MAVNIKMPALSPTMEEGKLAKWLVKEGDSVSSGDILAEIETDKATMEFETIDEGIVSKIMIAAGTEGVKVGTVIAVITNEDEGESDTVPAPVAIAATPVAVQPAPTPAPSPVSVAPQAKAAVAEGARIFASPLARRLAAERGIDLASLKGTGPGGRIVREDVEGAKAGDAAEVAVAPSASTAVSVADVGIPHEDKKLSGMRKTIARRLTQSMAEAPHIYLTVDVQLDALLKLRGALNEALAGRGVKLSVNDMLIKALGLALMQVPKCNVSFGGDVMRHYSRADISVAVSIPGGLITPIVTDAGNKPLATIATEMAALAEKAKAGKLQPSEYQGGTASISNMGMMGIKQFTAVINPPQAMILAVGAGEKRPWVQADGTLGVATVMSITGSFDHRAIDGADGAELMAAVKALVEKPLGLVV